MKIADINPDTFGAELADASQALVARIGATMVTITNRADLAQAVLDRDVVAAAIKHNEAACETPINLAYRLHRDLCDRRTALLAPLKALDRVLVTAIAEYKQRADRARAQRERDLADEQHRDQQARAAAEAAALESAGQHALAAAIVDEAIAAPLPPVALPDETKAVEGLKFRRRWLWRFAGGPKDVTATDPAIVARTLAVIPRDFLILDEGRLGQYARAMKEAARVEGIEFYPLDEPVR